MQSIDRRLLQNKPLDWLTPVYCPTLEDFLDLDNWSEILGILFVDVTNLGLSVDVDDADIGWQVYCQCLSLHRDKILPFLQLTLKDEVPLLSGSAIVIGTHIVTADEWQQFLNLIVLMYKLDWEVLRPEKTAKGSKLDEMRQRIAKTKATVQEVKRKQGTEVTLESMIKGLCGRDSSLSLLNIFKLNYYQFMNTLMSVSNGETFDYSQQAILQGADPKKVKIKHWTEN